MGTRLVLFCALSSLLLSPTHAQAARGSSSGHLALSGVYAVNITSSAPHQRTILNANSNFYCNADVAIAKCEFNIWEGRGNTQLTSDHIRAVYSHWTAVAGKLKYKDYRTSLSEGRCGMSVEALEIGYYMVGCRVHVDGQGWIYRYSTLIVRSDLAKSSYLQNVQSGYVLASPGTSVQLTCDTIDSEGCDFVQIHGLTRGSPSIRHGTTICNALYSVTENNSGLVWCEDSVNKRATVVIATKMPREEPTIRVIEPLDVSQGLSLLVICTVPESLPPATILWYVNDVLVGTSDSEFNGDVLPGYVLQEDKDDAWRWSWMAEGRKQFMYKQWTNQDSGMRVAVRCASMHSNVTLSSSTRNVVMPRGGSDGSSQMTSTTSGMMTTIELTQPTTDVESTTSPASHGGRTKTPSTKAPVPGGDVATCAALQDSSLNLDCHLAGETVDCSRRMRVGTQAQMTCAVGYLPTHRHGYNSVKCRKNRTWSRSLIKCIPDCGRSNAGGGQATVSRGQDVQVGEFSWHVGVYELNSTQHFEQICGGSLITPSFVLTAAHCFWDLRVAVNNVKDKSLFLIAAGKYKTDWYFEDSGVQRRNLSEIHLARRFAGNTLFLAYDIAVVRLSQDITLSWLVNVVCIDFDNSLEDLHLRNGKNGSISGWGVTEHNERSDVLKSVQLPYIPVEDCMDVVEAKFQKYLTHDKICAGFRNQSTSICPGDSGGAYVFPQETARGKRYYVRGIASVAHRPRANSGSKCQSDHVAAFTRVSEYRRWIESIVFQPTPD